MSKGRRKQRRGTDRQPRTVVKLWRVDYGTYSMLHKGPDFSKDSRSTEVTSEQCGWVEMAELVNRLTSEAGRPDLANAVALGFLVKKNVPNAPAFRYDGEMAAHDLMVALLRLGGMHKLNAVI
jgi:hypothetical protein